MIIACGKCKSTIEVAMYKMGSGHSWKTGLRDLQAAKTRACPTCGASLERRRFSVEVTPVEGLTAQTVPLVRRA